MSGEEDFDVLLRAMEMVEDQNPNDADVGDQQMMDFELDAGVGVFAAHEIPMQVPPQQRMPQQQQQQQRSFNNPPVAPVQLPFMQVAPPAPAAIPAAVQHAPNNLPQPLALRQQLLDEARALIQNPSQENFDKLLQNKTVCHARAVSRRDTWMLRVI